MGSVISGTYHDLIRNLIMKSPTNIMLKVVTGIFKDACTAYPDLKDSFLRDLRTLSLLVKNRGMGVFIHDLPNLDSLLLMGLETGRLVSEGPLSRKVSHKISVPRFLSGLWLRVFDISACLIVDADVNAILFIRQISVAFKKYGIDCTLERTERSTNEYSRIESECRTPTLFWADDVLDPNNIIHDVHFCDIVDTDIHGGDLFFEANSHDDRRRDSILLSNLQQTCDKIIGQFPPFHALSERCVQKHRAERGYRGRVDVGLRHGPGAVSEGYKAKDKYLFPSIPSKLRGVFPTILFGKKGYFNEESHPFHSNESPSRLVAVPKDGRGPRLIAAEPVSHQWAQQLVRGFVEFNISRLLPEYIDFRAQHLSQDCARKGSLDGSLATIDLASASDRLSCYVVERVFRRCPTLLRALHSCRTRYIRNEVSPDTWSYLSLRKYATQGTALTFPIQSLIFALCAISVLSGREHEDRIRVGRGNTRVFGDDIIIPKDRYDDMVRLLTILGLKVNTRKSFTHGLFRESCGGDFYRGYDVTPVKLVQLYDRKPASIQATIDNSNNLYIKGFWNASKVVEDQLGWKVNSLPIERIGAVQHGLVSYMGRCDRHLQYRYDYNLHVLQHRILHVRTRTKRIERDWRSAYLDNQFRLPYLIRDFSSWVTDRPSLIAERGWVTLLT